MKCKSTKLIRTMALLLLFCVIVIPAQASAARSEDAKKPTASPSPSASPQSVANTPSPKPAAVDKSTNVNVVLNGSLEKKGAVNVHKFTLANPGRVSLTFTHEYLNTVATYWILRLHDSDDTLLMDLYSSGNDTTKSTYNAYLSPGTYFVKITNDWWSDTKYGLLVNYTKNDGQFEIETNDSVETATKFNVNKEITGNMGSKSDLDCYKFNMAKEGKISLVFSHANLNTVARYWVVGLYDADDIELLSMDISGSETKKSPIDAFLCAGDYYVKIWGDWWNTADYKLLANYVPNNGEYEIEPDNSEDEATAIQLSKPIIGNLSYKDDHDWFSVKLSGQQKVSLTIAHKNLNTSAVYYVLRFYDSDGNKKIEMKCNGSEAKKTSEAISLEAGTYYVEILPDWWNPTNYTLTVNAK